MTAPAIRAALDAAARLMCREKSAAMGEPACWQVTGDSGEELPWPPDTCDCWAEAQVAVAAFVRALCEADAVTIEVDDASIYVGGLERLAAAVEAAAEGGANG